MLKKWSNEQIHGYLFKLLCIFIILQPIFDVLSQMDVRGYLPFGISTYVKPLFAGLMNIVLILCYKKQFWRCAIPYGAFLVFSAVHLTLLHRLGIDLAMLLHEARFMINLLYMLILYHDFRILYRESDDKSRYFKALTKTLVICFALYVALYLLAVITGTSGMTYEYSDATKLGFKGWFHSGQIFGHALCVCLPFLVCVLLNNKCQKPWLRLVCKLSIALPVLVLCLIGTKVSYYIPIIVLGVQVVLELFFAVRDKQRSHAFNALLCAVCVAVCLLAYPSSAVSHNTRINDITLATELSDDELTQFLAQEREYHLSQNWADRPWTERALDVLEEMFLSKQLHPSQMRNRQLHFNREKYAEAPLIYKLFGIGYLNQLNMAIERDVLCALFSFGVFGFLLFLARPIWLWLQSAFVILKKPFKADLTTLCLFEGLSMFFFISWYAGATFIYTQFSVFLVVILSLLTCRVEHAGNLQT